ncbi:radical SAM protein [Polymorphospora rubra]|uniref:radical SAM protein n=1 Tax=Polymorphospora rubra TaxID=338584 RepID=UPI001BB3A1DE|nr:radical SAM protein [Polymorphospora rubra]
MSSFEAELQPLASACVAAALQDQGAAVTAWDAHAFPDRLPDAEVDLVLLSVQQFEGLHRAVDLAPRLRTAHPDAPIVAFGQYAQMNSTEFLARVNAVAFDEPERIAQELCQAATGQLPLPQVPALRTASQMTARPPRRRITATAPARHLFPSLVHYPAHHTGLGLMGNIEVSRGCHHKCTYCSVYGAYDGGVAPYQLETVLADARQLADDGVRHFFFIDAEFFNSRTLGWRWYGRSRRSSPARRSSSPPGSITSSTIRSCWKSWCRWGCGGSRRRWSSRRTASCGSSTRESMSPTCVRRSRKRTGSVSS